MKVICNSIGSTHLCNECGASMLHNKQGCEPCPINKEAKCVEPVALDAKDLFQQYCDECGMDSDAIRATRWYKDGMIDYTQWLLEKLTHTI